MAAITDGTFTSPLQDGDKQVVFSFDFLGDAYARMITRPYVMLSSSYSAPRTLTTSSVTNYFQRSESFDNAYWTASALTVTADNTANPNDGATTADRLMETAVSSGHNIVTAVTHAATPTTVSVFAKANGRDWLEIATVDSAATVKRSFFDLTNGVVGTTSTNTTSAIVSVGNGWYRISQTWTSPAAGAGQVYFELSTNGSTISYLGDITKGVYMWGAQLEQASSLGSYLPTTSATRTSSLRTRDAVDNSGDTAADYFAFLCQETPPDAGSLRQGIARLSRTYMRVPAAQTDYGSSIINRPKMNNIKSGSSYAASFDDDTSVVWSARKTVNSISTPEAPANSSVESPATIGTLPASVTISFTGNTGTQTFAANASDATIKDQLSTAVTGSTASAANFKIVRNVTGVTVSVVTTNTTVSAISSDAASVVVTPLITLGLATGGVAMEIFSFEAATVNAASIRTLTTSAAHGFSAGNLVALWNGDKLVGTGTMVAAPTTTTLTIELKEIPGKDFAVTNCARMNDGTRYVNGPVSVSTKIVTDFYYPGWSPGITTPADIALVTPQLDPISWLGLIVAGTTYGVIEGSQLEKYLGGPFYSQTTVSAQMSDALDTVSASS